MPVDPTQTTLSPSDDYKALVYIGPRATQDGGNVMAMSADNKNVVPQLTVLRGHPAVEGFPYKLRIDAVNAMKYPGNPVDLAHSGSNKKALNHQVNFQHKLQDLVCS